MSRLILIERMCLVGHLISLVFGLAGLLLVLPHPQIILGLGDIGQQVFQISMSNGGVVYIILGAIAVAIYTYRTLGWWQCLTFLIPSVLISLGSELLGTSTGFPFGDYGYLSGLGYKIAGLVPFTIPLSWFYLGLVSYLLARIGLNADRTNKHIIRHIAAIALGAILLTSWDFVLDPAMSQTVVPFWEWKQPGAFFGMPYQNFAGWFGTGSVFMMVAAIFWAFSSNNKLNRIITRKQLITPLVVYLGNFAFAAVMSLAAGFWIPALLGVILGVIPSVLLWWSAPNSDSIIETEITATVSV